MFRVKRVAMTRFKHGRAAFDAGIVYRLRLAEAEYFTAAGWMGRENMADDVAPFVDVADALLDAGSIPARLPQPEGAVLAPANVVQKAAR